MSIAGSDSGGGAGIQADLKAFARCGVHGMSAITAITAQNTLGVDAVYRLPPEIVLAQVRAVIADIGVDAVKVGMLASVEIVHAVALALEELPAETPVVLDPVMVSESGARLLDRDAESALVAEILPRATIVTPNIPEARVLAGHAAPRQHEQIEMSAKDERSKAIGLAQAVSLLGPGIVVLTGGHRAQAIDLFLAQGAKAEEAIEIPGERYADGAAHGSGCTHSSVLAAQLALGHTPLQAAFTARALAGEAVAGGLRDVGEGPGPVDVFGLLRMRAPFTRGPE
ncbi:MAG TPA: bifunctional hydroxymethylpyrimidine kinase/phosphomethylpyrimidine kinase [Solirubrobacteraceae bacterium]